MTAATCTSSIGGTTRSLIPAPPSTIHAAAVASPLAVSAAGDRHHERVRAGTPAGPPGRCSRSS